MVREDTKGAVRSHNILVVLGYVVDDVMVYNGTAGWEILDHHGINPVCAPGTEGCLSALDFLLPLGQSCLTGPKALGSLHTTDVLDAPNSSRQYQANAGDGS